MMSAVGANLLPIPMYNSESGRAWLLDLKCNVLVIFILWHGGKLRHFSFKQWATYHATLYKDIWKATSFTNSGETRTREHITRINEANGLTFPSILRKQSWCWRFFRNLMSSTVKFEYSRAWYIWLHTHWLLFWCKIMGLFVCEYFIGPLSNVTLRLFPLPHLTGA